jgi:hypothetical protein
VKTVAYITTTDCRDYVMCMCNVLASRSARIINISRPEGFSHGPEDREWIIWFEHECAVERAWCESVLHESQKKWAEIKDAAKSDAGPATG